MNIRKIYDMEKQRKLLSVILSSPETDDKHWELYAEELLWLIHQLKAEYQKEIESLKTLSSQLFRTRRK